jgi:hypothetical protein
MKEVNFKLNVQEVGVILSALQLLELTEENYIAKEYGSVAALYDRLNEVWEEMDTSETGIRNDVVPSF